MTDYSNYRNLSVAIVALTVFLSAVLLAVWLPTLAAMDSEEFNPWMDPLANVQPTGQLREFTLEVQRVEHELVPGVVVETWAFGLEGEEPTVPGPELRVKQGDAVKVTFNNTHDQPHTIHFHGVAPVAMEMDGVPHLSGKVMPGETFTYEFIAWNAGTHVYHCHVETHLHLDMGMYGAFIVEPQEPEDFYDEDLVWILDDWDTRQDSSASIHAPDPNYYLINGKSFPAVEDAIYPAGTKLRLRLINISYEMIPIHLHGHSFLVTHLDGYPLVHPTRRDTVSIGPGERYDILIEVNEGVFPFHSHNLHQVTNDGVYPGGIHAHVGNGSGMPAEHAVHERDADDELVVLSGEVTVSLQDFAFNPQALTVEVGTTVTFVNQDASPHNVVQALPDEVSADAVYPFESPELAQGESWSFTFEEAGVYPVLCTVGGHYRLGMAGGFTVVPPE